MELIREWVDRTGQARPLPGKWRDLLRDGNQGDYPRDHSAVMAVLVVMVRHGWAWSDVYAAMTDPNNALSAYYRRRDDGRPRNQAAANKKLQSEWHKARTYVAEHPPIADADEARQHIGVLRECMNRYQWTGRSAGRNRQVLTILLDQATKHDTVSPSISMRAIVQRSSYAGLRTIGNALAALGEMGWIVADRRGCSADQPSVYRLALPRDSRKGDIIVPPGRGQSDVSLSVTGVHTGLAMVFTMAAATIYACLGDKAQPASAIMRRAGCSRDTVDRWLRRLEKVGLAHRTPDGWHKGTADPDEIAADFGANDVVAQRKTRHELQRRGYRECRAARRRYGGKLLRLADMRRGKSGGWVFTCVDVRRTPAEGSDSRLRVA